METSLVRDVIALILTYAVCLSALKFLQYLASSKIVTQTQSRKLIHICIGLLFVLCWPAYGDSDWSNWVAAFVPLTVTANFALLGLGILKDPEVVQSMSRSGNRSELLYGPLIYGATMVYGTVAYWRYNQVAIVSIVILCAGDGFAGLIGQMFSDIEKNKLPHNGSKSWQGTISYIFFSLSFSLIYLTLFDSLGYFTFNYNQDLIKLVLVTIITASIESLPLKEWDNLIIYVTVVFLYKYL